MKLVPSLIVLLLCFTSTTFAAVTVKVKNPGDFPREAETIAVPWKQITALLGKVPADQIVVSDSDGKPVVAQPVFFHGQRKPAEELIFQSGFKPNEEKSFTIAAGRPLPYEPKVYGRWIPERLDDFCWENDRIAFRCYGPTLEKVEPASSGIDVWCKRTPNLVINKWYQMAQSINDGYYHADRGEGLDGYHVGHGQGCGGTALWKDGKRYTTGFAGWKSQHVLANGPIRLVFELTYDPIDVAGIKVSETRQVTLDAGTNFNKIQSTFVADKVNADLTAAIGILKHDRPGEKSLHKDQGWMTYWDAADPSALAKDNGHIGCAVIVDPKSSPDMIEADGHLLAVVKIGGGGHLSYYSGAGWDRSGDFKTNEDWNNYVAAFAKRVQIPMQVTLSGD